jgi:hypothetical protein
MTVKKVALGLCLVCATNIDGVAGFAAYVPGVKVSVPRGKRPNHPDTGKSARENSGL